MLYNYTMCLVLTSSGFSQRAFPFIFLDFLCSPKFPLERQKPVFIASCVFLHMKNVSWALSIPSWSWGSHSRVCKVAARGSEGERWGMFPNYLRRSKRLLTCKSKNVQPCVKYNSMSQKSEHVVFMFLCFLFQFVLVRLFFFFCNVVHVYSLSFPVLTWFKVKF